MKTVLVIDDVAGNREIFASLLEGEYKVLQAADGKKGLELAESENPDIIFMDVSMPEIGGMDLIREFRKHPTLYAVPVVAITAHSLYSARKMVERGCNDFLLKPLTPHKIKDMLDKWIY